MTNIRSQGVVISHLLGGIGNQMFQYAAGRSLSLAQDQKHFLDLRDFSNYRLHQGFELTRVFNLSVDEADASVIGRVLGWRGNSLVRKILRRSFFSWIRGRKFIVEPHFNYWPELFKLNGDLYLHGYWQSERYFQSFEKNIRKDFTFREPLIGLNKDLALSMQGQPAISLHVRRGDYVSDAKNSNVMNICSVDYYSKAIAHIAEQVEEPVFYVFSDDIAWAREHIPMQFPCTYIDHNHGAESYRDMQLMSLCKHHIIANSSFSWWAAWLNPDKEKIVLAPKSWFVNGNETKDLFPAGWITL